MKCEVCVELCGLLICDRFGVDSISVEVEVDEHGAAADFAVVIPLGRHFARRGAVDGEGLETGGASDWAMHGGRGIFRFLLLR